MSQRNPYAAPGKPTPPFPTAVSRPAPRAGMLQRFRLPLIVTGITLGVVLLIGIVGITIIYQSTGSNRQKELRAQRLGSGAAALLVVVNAPFWIVAAAQLGKERRAAKAAGQGPTPRW